jgi:hypothetical protein
MNAANILENLNIEDMSTAKKASLIRDMMEYLKITDKEIEEYKNSQAHNPNFEKEQKEAAASLSPVIAQINETEKEATQYINPTESAIHQSNAANIGDIGSSSNSDESNSGNAEQSEENKDVQLAQNSDVQKFVIPIVVERIVTSGKQEKDAITYESVGYTATLKLENNSQTLNLNRNSTEEENQTAFVASKDSNDKEYTIVINNLTQDEFQQFKALFEEQKAREQNKKHTSNDNLGTELD